MYVLQKVTITLFQILFVAAFYAKTNVTSRAWKAACIGNWPSSLLRGGNELRLLIYAVRVCRFPLLLSIMFLDTLCSKEWYDMPHIVWYSFASVPRFPALVDIRLVTINWHARCFFNKL